MGTCVCRTTRASMGRRLRFCRTERSTLQSEYTHRHTQTDTSKTLTHPHASFGAECAVGPCFLTVLLLNNRCVELMQHPDMKASFGMAPASKEGEERNQEILLASMNCYAFVVCAQDTPGDAACPATVIGRAQVAVGTFDCQVCFALLWVVLCVCVCACE